MNRRELTITATLLAGIGFTALMILAFLNYAQEGEINSELIPGDWGSPVSKLNESSQSVLGAEVLSSTDSQGLPIQQLDLSPAQLFEQTQSSVVQITDSSESNPDDSRLGSGFVYDKLGHIITNYHVVSGGDRIDVTFFDGTIYRAELTGSDPYTDLAVLHVSNVPGDKLIPMIIANSTQLVVGQQIAAIGNPFGLTGSMTTGIVSGLGRLIPAQVQNIDESFTPFSIPDIIQTDASINPGNSGGPLLNMKAEVIGINSAIFSTTGEFAGIGFAVPSNTITKIVPSLIERGSFQHPWLGVRGTDMKPEIAEDLGLIEPRGFLVIDVVTGSPAEKAGIRGSDSSAGTSGEIPLGGDVIMKFDGRDMRKIDDILVYLQREKDVGDSIKLTVLRDGQMQELDVVLGARPGAAESP